MVMPRILAPVNTLVYGEMMRGKNINDQLSARDWLDQGLKTLAKDGFTALKAEPLAKAMRVSRGSFYWHFADIAAYHAAILARWHEVAAEQIIANVEAASRDQNPLALLLRRSGPGRASIPRPAPPCRPSTGAGSATSKAYWRRPDCPRKGPVPAPKFSIGRFLALRYRISNCRKRANRPCSTNCCGSLRHDTLRSIVLSIIGSD